MKRTIIACLTCCLVMSPIVMGGCATSGSAGSVSYSISFEATGMPKYDNFLNTAQTLVGELDKASAAMSDLVPSFQRAGDSILTAVGATGDLASKGSFGDVMGELTANLSEAKITLYLHVTPNQAMLKVRADGGQPDIVTKVEAALAEVNTALETIVQIPTSIEKVISSTASLATQAADLVTSAPSDFTGMGALKLPGCISALTDAITEIGKVPERAAALVESAIKMIEDFQSLGS